jgi:uncharacterized protein (DUF433 family)
MRPTNFLSSAEAAYVAGLNEPAINRAIAERVVSEPLIRSASARPISRLAAAFILFYCATAKSIPQQRRKATLASSVQRIYAAGKMHQALGLKLSSNDHVFDLQMTNHITAAIARSQKLDTTLRAISVSQEVMWGMPVFRGTRVPIDTVIGALEDGAALALLKESYAFLTEDLIEAARIYIQVHPLQEHARHLSDGNPACKLKNVVTIRSHAMPKTSEDMAPPHLEDSMHYKNFTPD